MRAYAIGDIHGHLDLLKAAQALVAQDRARTGDMDAPLIHTGDLVDRGPESQGVIAHLMEGQARGEPWGVLKGNHDNLFEMFLYDPGFHDPNLNRDLDWLNPRVGGSATLRSYGVDPEAGIMAAHAQAAAAVPKAHRDWLSRLPTHLLLDDLLFVHAGIRPGVDLHNQTETDLMWIRSEFLEDLRDHGALVVHGHSAIETPTHYGNRLNIDSNAARGGPVSAVVIEGRDAWLLAPEGRVRL